MNELQPASPFFFSRHKGKPTIFGVNIFGFRTQHQSLSNFWPLFTVLFGSLLLCIIPSRATCTIDSLHYRIHYIHCTIKCTRFSTFTWRMDVNAPTMSERFTHRPVDFAAAVLHDSCVILCSLYSERGKWSHSTALRTNGAVAEQQPPIPAMVTLLHVIPSFALDFPSPVFFFTSLTPN